MPSVFLCVIVGPTENHGGSKEVGMRRCPALGRGGWHLCARATGINSNHPGSSNGTDKNTQGQQEEAIDSASPGCWWLYSIPHFGGSLTRNGFLTVHTHPPQHNWFVHNGM